MRLIRISWLLLCSLACLSGQTLNDGSLSGDYHLVQLLVDASSSGTAENAHNLSGTITFDGAGAFTFAGTIGSGANAPIPAAGVGSYSVTPSGSVLLDNPNPQAADIAINARLGEAAEVLLGSSTEATDGTVDFFVAVRAPAAPLNQAALTGDYAGASLGLLGGSESFLASTLLTFSSSGNGMIPSVGVVGHAVDLGGDVTFSEETLNVPYTINADGSGVADFGGGFGEGSGLFFGNHDIFVSASGNYVIGSSREETGRQVFVAVRRFSDVAHDADWSGDYWFSEISIDGPLSSHSFASHTGDLRSFLNNEQGTVAIAKRTHLMAPGAGPAGLSSDFSGRDKFRINADSRGSFGPSEDPEHVNFAVGAPSDGSPQAFVGARITVPIQPSAGHGIFFGVRRPSLSGPDVFLNPLGALNGASFAPSTFPIAPGTIVSLFGTSLAPPNTDVQAESTPLPTNLAGVTVTVDGILAPLLAVKAGPEFDQVNIQVPFAAAGPTAQIIVNNNGTPSNAAEVRVAASSPGAFSANASGIGAGAITHADFSLVTEQNPAAPGEVVIIFLTGLGAVSPPVADGVAGPSDPLSRAVDEDNVVVRFDGDLAGEVLYAGLAPDYVGLYQINVKIPNDPSLAAKAKVQVQTGSAVSDFVDIAIGLQQ